MTIESEVLGRRTYTVDEVAVLFDISRNAAYEAARTGAIPTVRIGKTIRCPRALVDRMLGTSDEAAARSAAP